MNKKDKKDKEDKQMFWFFFAVITIMTIFYKRIIVITLPDMMQKNKLMETKEYLKECGLHADINIKFLNKKGDGDNIEFLTKEEHECKCNPMYPGSKRYDGGEMKEDDYKPMPCGPNCIHYNN